MLGIFLEHKANTPEDKRQKATLRTNSVIAIADTLPYINLPLQQQEKKPKRMDWFYGAEIYSNRVNRSNWNDKSQAALRREEEAINLFNDTFMKMANQATEFPFIMDGLIPPTTHLKDACWKTFKQVITAKGCKAKRRVITPAERIALKGKNTRSGKMYSISVTAPSHPSQVLAALEAKRVKAAAAKERKEQDAKKRQQDEADMKALVLQDYAKVVELVASVGKGIDFGVDSKKRPLEESKSEIKKSGSEKKTIPKVEMGMVLILIIRIQHQLLRPRNPNFPQILFSQLRKVESLTMLTQCTARRFAILELKSNQKSIAKS